MTQQSLGLNYEPSPWCRYGSSSIAKRVVPSSRLFHSPLHVFGSPFKSYVAPSMTCGATSHAAGPGLCFATAGHYAAFTIQVPPGTHCLSHTHTNAATHSLSSLSLSLSHTHTHTHAHTPTSHAEGPEMCFETFTIQVPSHAWCRLMHTVYEP